jgi:hypothetical protein
MIMNTQTTGSLRGFGTMLMTSSQKGGRIYARLKVIAVGARIIDWNDE